MLKGFGELDSGAEGEDKAIHTCKITKNPRDLSSKGGV